MSKVESTKCSLCGQPYVRWSDIPAAVEADGALLYFCVGCSTRMLRMIAFCNSRVITEAYTMLIKKEA